MKIYVTACKIGQNLARNSILQHFLKKLLHKMGFSTAQIDFSTTHFVSSCTLE